MTRKVLQRIHGTEHIMVRPERSISWVAMCFCITIVLGGVLCLAACSFWGLGECVVSPWGKAEAKWEAFAQPYLGNIRQQESDASIEWVEFRSQWISRYLPGWRIYTLPVRKGGVSALFALSRHGEIVDLRQGDQWSGKEIHGYYSNPPISDFFRARKIKVSNAKKAVNVLKCILDVSRANNTVAVAKYNRVRMEDANVYDKDIVQGGKDYADWNFIATRKGNAWVIQEEYVGPPAMILAPATWQIVTDEKDIFLEIRLDQRMMRNPEGSQ